MQILKKGSKGTDVKILQCCLNITPDGIFGDVTQENVKVFQTQNNLAASGIADDLFWKRLGATMPIIKKGNKGNKVRAWQLFIGETADGIFGSKTKAATVAFQASANIPTTGVVDQNTWITAFSIGVKLAVNEKPVDYKQYDKRWASTVYTKNNTYNKKQTIKNSGCGPTAMADVVATWWDSKVTPATLAKMSVEHGYRTENSGTSAGFFKYIAEKYKASKYIQTTSYATAEKALKEGALIVANMGKGLFTKGGHYICWWKTDGTYNYTNDPASSSSKRAKQAVKYIKNEAKRFFIFFK